MLSERERALCEAVRENDVETASKLLKNFVFINHYVSSTLSVLLIPTR